MKQILLFPFKVLQRLALIIWLIVTGTFSAVVAVISFTPRLGHWCVKNIYCRGFFRIMGYMPTQSGLESLDTSKTYVLAANHESHLDTQAIYMLYPKYLHFIGKKELKYVPVVGWVIWSLGMIFIDRKNPEKAKASLAKAAELIRNGKNVISFPEGTRTKDGEIKRFKRGLFAIALQAGVDVIPVAVSGAREVMPSGSANLAPGPIHISYGQPISHRQYIDDPEGFATACREQVLLLKAAGMKRIGLQD